MLLRYAMAPGVLRSILHFLRICKARSRSVPFGLGLASSCDIQGPRPVLGGQSVTWSRKRIHRRRDIPLWLLNSSIVRAQ